jgi:hypothetical protein
MSDYYGAISIASNVLGVIGYFPEIYSIIYDLEVKITTKIWIIWIVSGGLGITYGACIHNSFVIISNCITTCMCLIVFSVKNGEKQKRQRQVK